MKAREQERGVAMSVGLIHRDSGMEKEELDYGLVAVLRSDVEERLLGLVKLQQLDGTALDKLLEEMANLAALREVRYAA